MTDITVFTSIRNVYAGHAHFLTITATNAVKAGQVMEIDATGVDFAANVAISEVGSSPIGVALYDAGSKVTLATIGAGPMLPTPTIRPA